ncbi:MAG TPA: GAF domain-containing protein [Abditibacteriaceae bacterium]|nr:GAF domain-containing protein [Abditibacteriaceae bacterium]
MTQLIKHTTQNGSSRGASDGASALPDSEDSLAQGTLARGALPSAAFDPDDFDVELSQTSLAGADELLKATLDDALKAVGGTRAFLALVDMLSGELVVRFAAGPDWTEDMRELSVNVHLLPADNTPSPLRSSLADADAASDATATSDSTTLSRQGITRHVVVNSRPYWTEDTSQDPYYIELFPDARSEIAVPITMHGGGTIGVINVDSTLPGAFHREHAQQLTVLARRVAVIIAMAEHQLREEALIAIGQDLNSTADLETLMQDVVEQATKILRADDCSLFLADENADTLQLAASHGPLHEQVGQTDVRYMPGEGLTGWVAQHATVIRVGDPRTDPRWKGLFMEAPAGELAAVMAVPVLCQRSKPGVLRVVRHRKGSLYFLPHEFSQADEDILVTLAGQLAVAIDRTRLTTRLLHAERMAAWGEMSARSAHMIGNTVFGIKGHLNELSYLLKTEDPDAAPDERGSVVSAGPTPAAVAPSPSRVVRPVALHEARLLQEHITQGIYRLEEILGEFRDFVLATQLHARENDINQILRTVTAESFPKHSNIDLVLNLAPGLPPVLADEAKLKRAFGELIENSIDFQPNGGMLTIRTALAEAEAARQLPQDRPVGPILQIEFIDRGPGLSEQDRERVFTPFYTRKAKGMGLGLSIVKGIIEAHRGTICEAGQRGDSMGKNHGAHFVILLPAHGPTNGAANGAH